MLHRRMERKVTYYDIKLKRIVDNKNEHTITFDSRSEFRCWQLLSDMCTGCFITHPYVIELKGDKKWKCDFAITATTTQAMQALGKLRSVLLQTDSTPEFMLLLEYKGTLDKNFVEKMHHICKYEPVLFDDLILISRECCGYAWEDLSTLRTCVKVIHSEAFLKESLKYAFSTSGS